MKHMERSMSAIRGGHNLIFIILIVIAVILSAQCTDARVNIVTKDLFQKYPSKNISITHGNSIYQHLP